MITEPISNLAAQMATELAQRAAETTTSDQHNHSRMPTVSANLTGGGNSPAPAGPFSHGALWAQQWIADQIARAKK